MASDCSDFLSCLPNTGCTESKSIPGNNMPRPCNLPSSSIPSSETPSSSSTSFRLQAIAAVAGSTTATLCLNPVVVTKIRMQGQALGTASIPSVVKGIYKQNGISGFCAGSRAGLLQAVPSSVLYMTTYERCKKFFSTCSDSRYISAYAGAVARAIAVTITSPFELVRTVQSSSAASEKTVFQLLSSIVANDGVRGLYKGYSSTLLRDVPFSALYWLVYDKAKSSCSHSHLSQNKVNFLSAATAGVLAAVITHPFDVLKTQQQLAPVLVSEIEISHNGITSPLRFNFMKGSCSLAGIQSLYKNGGIVALYRGLLPRLATVGPAGAIMMTTYEFVKAADI